MTASSSPSTCHCKDADPDVQVPPSDHCDFAAPPGAPLLLLFGLLRRPDTCSQYDRVKHPHGQQSQPICCHLRRLQGADKG